MNEEEYSYLTLVSRKTLLQSNRIIVGNSIGNARKLRRQIETSSDATRFWELPDDI